MTFRGPGRACLARVVGPPSPSLPRMLLALACASTVAFGWSVEPVHALPPPVAGRPFPEPVRPAWLEGRLPPARHAGAGTAPAAPIGVIDEPPDGGGASAIQARAATGRWHVPVLLVDFPDRPATHPAGAFRTLLFDTTGAVPSGSMARYFEEVSGNQLL